MDESEFWPMIPPKLLTPLTTVAPFEMPSELLEPSMPTMRSPEFVKSELLPVAKKLILEEFDENPIKESATETIPPLVIAIEKLLLLLPAIKSTLLEIDPRMTVEPSRIVSPEYVLLPESTSVPAPVT